jgi:hypothetical protein
LSASVIESVTFSLADNVSDEEFLAAAEEPNKYLRCCNGFVGRQISNADGSLWLDLVFWESMDAALAAAARFNESPHITRFNSALKRGSVTISHFTIQANVRPSAT